MMPEQDYAAILTNLSRQVPVDLDAAIFDAPDVGGLVEWKADVVPPSAMLWQCEDTSASRIGIRVREPIENQDFLAARLAAIAMERKIFPVFLSYIDSCGMQRFGFRVEQLSGLTEEAQQSFEEQLTLFWKFALVIDASDIERLG